MTKLGNSSISVKKGHDVTNKVLRPDLNRIVDQYFCEKGYDMTNKVLRRDLNQIVDMVM